MLAVVHESVRFRGDAVIMSIKHRFIPRKLEWVLAWITMMLGIVFLLPYETFEGSGYVIFQALMSESMWGALFFLLGAFRLIGLIINGAMKTVTPWIRAFSAGIGFFLWVGISLAFFLSGSVSTWIAVYPTFIVCEIINLYQSMRDTGESYASRPI